MTKPAQFLTLSPYLVCLWHQEKPFLFLFLWRRFDFKYLFYVNTNFLCVFL